MPHDGQDWGPVRDHIVVRIIAAVIRYVVTTITISRCFRRGSATIRNDVPIVASISIIFFVVFATCFEAFSDFFTRDGALPLTLFLVTILSFQALMETILALGRCLSFAPFPALSTTSAFGTLWTLWTSFDQSCSRRLVATIVGSIVAIVYLGENMDMPENPKYA